MAWSKMPTASHLPAPSCRWRRAFFFWKKASNLGAGLAITAGLSVWLILEILGIEEPVEPQLIGLIASALGMLIGSAISPNRAHGHGGDARHV